MDDGTLHADLFIARKSCQQMRGALLLSRNFDDQWLAQLRKCAATASGVLNDDDCRAFLVSVLAYAEDLCSPEGTDKWARPRGMTGTNYLKLQIICKLTAFQQRLSDIERMRSMAERLVASVSALPEPADPQQAP